MIFYFILFLIILAIIIWGGVTRWRFVNRKGKEEYEKDTITNSEAAIKKKYDMILQNIPAKQRAYSVFSSEARALIDKAQHFDIDMLIESGTAHGVSTEIISRLLPNVEIHTIDSSDNLFEKTKDRLNNCCKNVILHKDNSIKLIPALLSREKKKRIGIFIDGPKGKTAKEMAQKYIQMPNVFFVGIHDTAPHWKDKVGKYDQRVLDEFGVKLLHTWKNPYRDKWKFLDEFQLRNDWNSSWPHPIGQYEKGHGLDVLFKKDK